MSEQDTGTGVLKIGGKRYAVGLMWFTAQEEDGKEQARLRARKAAGDFFCVRSRVTRQHGVGFSNQGHRAGMPVAAEIVATLIVGEWHGVFEADNGWWYLQVHADAIAPNGDRFFTSEEEAYNTFLAASKDHTWAESYAPKEWDLPFAAKILTLDKLLDDPLAIKLLSLKTLGMDGGGGGAKKIVAALLIIALLGGGYYVYDMITAPIPAYVPPPPRVVKPKITNEPEEIVVETKTLPRPSEVMAACGEGFGKMMVQIAGWDLQKASCDGEKAIITWRRAGGNLIAVRQAMTTMPQAVSFRLEDAEFSTILKVASVGEYERRDLVSALDAMSVVESRFAKLGKLEIDMPRANLGEQLRENKSRSSKRGGANLQILEPTVRVKLITKASPESIAGFFDINALQVKQIEWRIPEREWSYEFEIAVST